MSLESGLQNNTQETKSTAEKMQELMLQVVAEAEAYEIKPEDKNEKGELLVSPKGLVSNLGKQSELWWKMARTESFKNFFGDWQNESKESSKILDKNGEPLIVFRGVRKDISLKDFYDNDFYIKINGTFGAGVYFTPQKELAEEYTEANNTDGKTVKVGSIFPAFLNARHPHYQENLVDLAEDFRKNIVTRIPKKILDVMPKVSFTDYDSVYGGKIAKYDYSHSRRNLSGSAEAEESYEIYLKSPDQVLIIPSVLGNK